MTNIKLLVATHKLYEMPSDKELYLPIHVGAQGKESIGFCGDNTGNHISELNSCYCELTGLYWAWKNLNYDYLGLVHYRRYLTTQSRKFHEGINIDEVVLSKKEIEKLLENNSVIVPKKRNYYIETLYSHYAHTFDGKHLDIARQIISEKTPEYLSAFDKVMKQRSGYMFNMFIMSKEYVNEYCEWLFKILDCMYEQIDISDYTAFEARLFGRVSELLFNVWLEYKNIQPKEVPFMYMAKVDLIQKGISFLQAKFFGKKYEKSF